MNNRRSFLQGLGLGAIGAAAASLVPEKLLANTNESSFREYDIPLEDLNTEKDVKDAQKSPDDSLQEFLDRYTNENGDLMYYQLWKDHTAQVLKFKFHRTGGH